MLTSSKARQLQTELLILEGQLMWGHRTERSSWAERMRWLFFLCRATWEVESKMWAKPGWTSAPMLPGDFIQAHWTLPLPRLPCTLQGVLQLRIEMHIYKYQVCGWWACHKTNKQVWFGSGKSHFPKRTFQRHIAPSWPKGEGIWALLDHLNKNFLTNNVPQDAEPSFLY